jgi:hypothetical protein
MGLIIRGVGTTSSRLRDWCARLPRVARRLATLGFVAESLWDSCWQAGFKSSQGAATTECPGSAVTDLLPIDKSTNDRQHFRGQKRLLVRFVGLDVPADWMAVFERRLDLPNLFRSHPWFDFWFDPGSALTPGSAFRTEPGNNGLVSEAVQKHLVNRLAEFLRQASDFTGAGFARTPVGVWEDAPTGGSSWDGRHRSG